MGFSLKLFSRCLLLICICIGEYQCKNVEIQGSARNGYFSKVKRGYLDRFHNYRQSRASNFTEKFNTLDNRTLELQDEIEKLWEENKLLWEKVELIQQSLSDDQPDEIESEFAGVIDAAGDYVEEPVIVLTPAPKENMHGAGKYKAAAVWG